MKTPLILLLLLTLITGCFKKKEIIIKPFTVMNRIDTLKDGDRITISKTDYFLINDYSDNKRYEKFIDSFMLKNKATDFDKYTNYSMVLYKESEKTNLTGSPYTHDIVNKYSRLEDLVMDYQWQLGKFQDKHKFKDGQNIDTPDDSITIGDVK